MSNKDTKYAMWPAIVHAKCPRCRRGNMFSTPMYSFHSQKMNTACPHCGLVFEREPGYFYVAMFVSYALFVAEMVTLAVAISVLTGSHNPWVYVSIIVAVGVILSPFNFRYSRVLLLHWLTPGLHYHPEMSKDVVS
ncbi:DUF983 domain-containing protein [Mucilaginibacter sp. X4EP1]|uniref:DUF983 domain-containing protein n=1 Tax=Mucilaginibacter sp. X4EP1 TaxID=2723092 RepID=UPI00216A915D|nr:DUF983 domain-containing protein [Mucilaginibacter sp. X4EP1]MCS3815628.1 uncharacterized protein (DUF983 family) [Mucilaginibacter sp. X4EP1]